MKNNKLKIESEVKIQLTKDEFSKISKKIIEKGFSLVSSNKISDYYLKKLQSKHGGWDFDRLRSVDDSKYIFTNKEWSLDQNGYKVRNEDEKEVSIQEFQKLIKNYSVLINKNRTNYKGLLFNKPATISLDELHVNQNYYFIECEIMTDIKDASIIRKKIFQWMKDELKLKDKKEALSMLGFIDSIKF